MRKSERVEVGPACGRCGQTNRPERSFCRKCGAYLKPAKPIERKPLPATTRRWSVNSGTPKPISDRRREDEKETRDAVVAWVRKRDVTCRAISHGLTGITCSGRLDVHEIIPRSAWPGGHLVADNCLLICRAHHRWIDNHPAGAHALGLHGFSWERPGAVPVR